MRSLAVSIWIFVNLIFMGMCGYLYLLWSQYWLGLELQQTGSSSSTPKTFYDQQIYYYSRGRSEELREAEVRRKRQEKLLLQQQQQTNVTFVKDKKPRFPKVHLDNFEPDTKRYRCYNDTPSDCRDKTNLFARNLLYEFRRIAMLESSTLRLNGDHNPYEVREDSADMLPSTEKTQATYCHLRDVQLRTIRNTTEPFASLPHRKYLRGDGLLEGQRFGRCALVTSSGALLNSGLGEFIDSHDFVLRFNNAPTEGFATDVGSKTSMRILNSQVVSRPEYGFLESGLYRGGVLLLVWDPSRYAGDLGQWLASPDHDFWPALRRFRRRQPQAPLHLVDPRSIWDMWRYVRAHSAEKRVRRNPVSSGFMGIALLLKVCDLVNVLEYIPSTRVTRRCHYYDPGQDIGCTFGAWHPLAAEKMLVYSWNSSSEHHHQIFQQGFITLRGCDPAP